MYSTRLKWLDIAKGITIILMVLGHTSIPDTLSRFIFAFHMPLFFIASGWTTNWNKYDFKNFVVAKFRSIMIPFMVYSAIVLVMQATLMGGGNVFLDWLKYGWQGYALWFIPVLFLASVLGRLIHLVENEYFYYAMMVFFIAIGSLLKYVELSLPWTLCSVPFACFFVMLGTKLKNFQKIISAPNRWLIILNFMLTAVISHYWKLDMAWNNIIPVVPLAIGAVAGTIMIFGISSYIERNFRYLSNILSNVGKETFVIVAFSQLIIMLLIQYTSWHSVTRYTVLVICIAAIIYVKNKLVKILK